MILGVCTISAAIWFMGESVPTPRSRIGATFAATFESESIDHRGRRTGHRRVGQVAVRDGRASYRIISSSPGSDSVMMVVAGGATVFTDAFDMNTTIPGAVSTSCAHARPVVDLSEVTDALIDQHFTLLNETAEGCDGEEWAASAFGTDYVACMVNGIPTRIRGDSFVLTFVDFFPGLEVEFELPIVHCKPGPLVSPALGPPSESWWHADGVAAKRRRRLSASDGRHICFMHGMGEPASVPVSDGKHYGKMESNGRHYWGDVCSEIGADDDHCHFIHKETQHLSWDDDSYRGLAQTYVRFINDHKCDVVFAHGLANNILAKANALGYRVDWFAVQAPFRGTWLANVASSACSGSFMNLYRHLATAWGYCNDNGGPTVALRSLHVVNPAYTLSSCVAWPSCKERFGGAHECGNVACDKLWLVPESQDKCCDSGRTLIPESAYRNNIRGKLCGTYTHYFKDAWEVALQPSLGLNWATGKALTLLHDIADFGERSDGVVAESSCMDSELSYGEGNRPSDRDQFVAQPSSRFYGARLNHADGTCVHGNDADNAQKACSWFAHMASLPVERCPTDANVCSLLAPPPEPVRNRCSH
jgi:hypothetical protein